MYKQKNGLSLTVQLNDLHALSLRVLPHKTQASLLKMVLQVRVNLQETIQSDMT